MSSRLYSKDSKGLPRRTATPLSAFTVSLAVITPAMAQPWPSGIGSGYPSATAYPPTAAPTTPS